MRLEPPTAGCVAASMTLCICKGSLKDAACAHDLHAWNSSQNRKRRHARMEVVRAGVPAGRGSALHERLRRAGALPLHPARGDDPLWTPALAAALSGKAWFNAA